MRTLIVTGAARGLLVAALLGAIGCAPTGAVFPPHVPPTLRARLSLASVEVVDQRTAIVSEPLDPPTITTPGDGERAELPVSPATRNALRARLRKLLVGGELPVAVRVEIHEGVAGWRSDWIREYAFVHTEIAIVVVAHECRITLLTARGVATGERGGADVADGDVDRLFQESVLSAFDHGFATDATMRALNAAIEQVAQQGCAPSAAEPKLADSRSGTRRLPEHQQRM